MSAEQLSKFVQPPFQYLYTDFQSSDQSEKRWQGEAAKKITNHIVGHTRIYNPFRETGPKSLSGHPAGRYLKDSGLWDRFWEISQKEGAGAYENRFVAAFASLAFLATGVHPIKHEEKRKLMQDFLDFVTYSGFLPHIEAAWQEKRERFGVLTSPEPIPLFVNMEPTAWVGRYLKPDYFYVDVWSEPDRYPGIVTFVSSVMENYGTVVEFGSCAADTLLEILDQAKVSQAYGMDRLTAEEATQDQMMTLYRWGKSHGGMPTPTEIEQKIENHIGKIHNEHRLVLLKGSVFDSRAFKKLHVAMNPHRFMSPLVVLCTNVLFPHYDVKHIEAGIRRMLSLKPKYLILAGGVPELEYKDLNTGEWSRKKAFHVFQFELSSTGDIRTREFEVFGTSSSGGVTKTVTSQSSWTGD